MPASARSIISSAQTSQPLPLFIQLSQPSALLFISFPSPNFLLFTPDNSLNVGFSSLVYLFNSAKYISHLFQSSLYHDILSAMTFSL